MAKYPVEELDTIISKCNHMASEHSSISDEQFPCHKKEQLSQDINTPSPPPSHGQIDECEIITVSPNDATSSLSHGKHSWLLRLFESSFCDISMALSYFFNSSHEGIALYLGNKLFSYNSGDVSWYLLQLVHMYLHVENTQTIMFRYLNEASAKNLKFSLLTTWLLEAYLLGSVTPSAYELALNKKLLNSILSSWCNNTQSKSTTKSRFSHMNIKNNYKDSISLFIAERYFVTELVLIGKRLEAVSSKNSRLHRLHSELFTLDRSLSQAVFIPIAYAPDHVVVRIAYRDSYVLNSKEKAPYLVYIEVIEQDDALNSYSNIMELKQKEYQRYFNSLNCATNKNLQARHSFASSLHQSMDKLFTITPHPSPNNHHSCSEGSIDHCGSLDRKNTSDSPYQQVSVMQIRDSLKTFNDSTQTFSSSKSCDDPSAAAILELWERKLERIRASSPFGHINGWNLYSIIVKCGDDLRQDYLAYQFLKKCKDIWESENVSLWVRPYAVVITESHAGLIEAITDSVSIHQIKNRTGVSLEEYFRMEYGIGSDLYSEAKKNFIRSLAGYSLFQYIFQVKDRHNGNILLHFDGHIIHVDFGYILGQSPKSISFETSPFKMTSDFMELLEGPNSDFFLYFKSLLLHGFLALRKHSEKLMILVEILKLGNQMPCLGKNGASVDALKRRFHPDMNDDQISNLIDKLVDQSINSVTTVLYDKFQYYTNGIIA